MIVQPTTVQTSRNLNVNI